MATARRSRQAPEPAKPAPQGSASSFGGAATTEDGPCPEDVIEVGRVLGAWGVRGGIKVKPFSADPQALFATKRWWVLPADRAPQAPSAASTAAVPRLLHVTQAREQGDTLVATCQELQDRDAAEALTGARLLVSRASFPTPDPDEFYWVDLIGLQVRNRQGQMLGAVSHLIETGPHCVLCLVSADTPPRETMIPFVDAYVDRVDRDAGLIEVDWDAED